MTTPSVPNSTNRQVSTPNPIEEVVQEVEHIFEPRPGGMIDSWHKDKARREAAAQQAANAAERIEEHAAYTVKVAQVMPEITAINSINIGAGGTAQVLPNQPYRYRAVIKTSAAITLAKDNSQALGGIGYPLAPTDPPLVINSRAQLYASAVGAAVISVISELYAPES